jgi:DNA-binding MarR family transcriptional regulator
VNLFKVDFKELVMTELKLQLYGSLKAIFLHIDNHEKAFLAQFGLNIPRYFVLFHLNNKPGITNMDLSDLLLCTKSNTSRIVQGMIKDGYLTRLGHPDDGRSFQLYLSEKGKALFDEVQPAFNQKIVELMSLIDSDKIDPYLRVSQSIEHILASARQTPLL